MGDLHASKDGQPGSQLGATTQAGWYDDGSGRLRWWDGRQWTAHVSTAVEVPQTSSHGWWVWSPAYTLGLISFVPALHAALKLKRRDLGVWATGLIAGNVTSWSLMTVGPSTPDGSNTALGDVGAIMSMTLAALGTIQAFRTRTDVFRPSQADPLPVTSVTADPAVVDSLAARRRRAESVALIAGDPGLARDLKIGRPDLTREYDDGGLVDVNHVPAAVLVSHLGLSLDEALSVIEARDHLGGFTSADEICGFVAVPPQALDAVRDRIVAL